MAFDFKKEYKEFYMPKNKPGIVTPSGTIHYWINAETAHKAPQLIFLPGLTADHRLFDKQIEYFEGKYPVLVWDAPGHASRPARRNHGHDGFGRFFACRS